MSELKRQDDFERLIRIEEHTRYTKETVEGLQQTLKNYPIVEEKVFQHDKWIIKFIGAIIALAFTLILDIFILKK